ncbi:gliding motility lipoprotein GldB [Pseudotenacibaculum sp. MALMAid0570]|uniref:gliding motility lipoprotein GldB n=1 Tax=Pseudotenacibaculum sp. MALMAid0570 TaxID=3143938 RepID=UPI0032DFB961
MRNFFFFLIVSTFLFSCEDEPKNIVDLSGINVNFTVKRFDVDFYQSNQESLGALKVKYPDLFPKETNDSVWIAKINDPDEQELYRETQKVYQDFSKTRNEFEELFKHVKYYNKDFIAPSVITVLSNIDYEYRVIYASPLLFISLDVYLGVTSPFYADYPDYIKINNKQERIVVDVANQFIDLQVKQSLDRTFLGKMIAAGKKQYLLDLYLPRKSDLLKIGYSKEKLTWAEDNEAEIWRYFIENDLLYSTDTKLNKRFLDEAPFSKFYLAEDANSPGRIGEWIGWQIVRSFMEKNDVSLQTLLKMNAEEIFKKSKYKPKR